MWNIRLLLWAVAVSSLGISLVGCTSERDQLVNQYTAGNIKKMAIIYNAYTGLNQWKGPQDEAQLRDWMQSGAWKKKKMEKLNISADKFDDYLISERTGEKFEIRWGVNSAPMGPPRPVIFEATEIDGIRQVGLAGGGEVLDVETDEEYDELMSGVYVPDDFEKYPNRAKKSRKKKK